MYQEMSIQNEKFLDTKQSQNLYERYLVIRELKYVYK